MENQDQELDEDITLLLSDAENALTALKGLGYKEEIEDLLGKVFPKPKQHKTVPTKARQKQAKHAFDLGKAEYKAGEPFETWISQPTDFSEHYKAGWLSEAQECAVLKDVIDDLFENAADHQYWLEASKVILSQEAELTSLMSRRNHFQNVTKHLESHLRLLRKITGQDEITVTTETLNTKEGQEEAKVGLG